MLQKKKRFQWKQIFADRFQFFHAFQFVVLCVEWAVVLANARAGFDIAYRIDIDRGAFEVAHDARIARVIE